MRDYAELIKALRCCSKIDARDNGCDSCPYEYCGDDCQNLCGCAADAIEELLDRDVVPTEFHERCLRLEIKKRIELERQLPPHGDLIDRDWLKEMAYSKVEDFGCAFVDSLDIAIAPVVIPATERSEDK